MPISRMQFFKKICDIVEEKILIGPIYFFICLSKPPYSEYIMTLQMFYFLVLINPSWRDKIINIAILLGRKIPVWLA